ncbi:MAG: phosphoenolpyruvate synthase [Chloroflexi bacterium]|nr:phosphoenolpyruvate synthase [Chloroflexota bacterium]
MNLDPDRIPKVLELYLQISQYPILGRRIRDRMRAELFSRGVITRAQFEQEAKEKAVRSQVMEGISDPFSQETAETWQQRIAQVRDHLTDFYFAYNLPHSLFEEIVREVLAESALGKAVTLPFNPEMAPWHVLLTQAKEYDALPPDERRKVRHHLEEIRVVLTKAMISDQMDFVRLGKEFLCIEDFERVGKCRIGEGKIGGKSAGMLLAWRILQRREPTDEVDLLGRVVIPDSYFIGADVFYDFHALNGLDHFLNQKYKTQQEIESDYPHIKEAYAEARFPEPTTNRLHELILETGNNPLIVRSSSLLEDNFGFSFAGKYESIFCPNQGSTDENLTALTRAISLIYASVLSPDALLYRRRMGLVDYDERMAILIQKVQGRRHGSFFLPTLAGVGFSRNPFRWNPKIRAEDGLLRIVCGMGTRAVDRVGNDYPRMVALSHPTLRPELGPSQIRKYSQRFIDLIDLEANEFRTVPAGVVLKSGFPGVQMLASQDKGDYLQPVYAPRTLGDTPLILTFDTLLKNQDFVGLMRTVLRKLASHYGCPVDTEFTVEITHDRPPRFILHLLQCRPLSGAEWDQNLAVPEVAFENIVFYGRRLAPHGLVEHIRYIVYVQPEAYERAPDTATRLELARAIGRLNQRLAEETFILMGPGRWGSSNVELGLKVTYADIYNARALIEIAHSTSEYTPELSYGTHFFQDLVETHIYPVPLFVDEPETIFNTVFFRQATNSLSALQPEDAQYSQYIQVIDVPAVTRGRFVELVMHSDQEKALAYLKRYPEGIARRVSPR